MEKPTTILGKDGVEYVVSGGKLVEKCRHRTRRDESQGTIRKEVCHDCRKVMIYNGNTSEDTTDTIRDFQDNFRNQHGKNPSGTEMSAMMF